MVSRVVNISLRALQFVLTFLIMALIGNAIAEAVGGNPSIINYTMFVAVFSMLSQFYLLPISFNDGFMGHAAIPLVLDVLNVLFFFCGAVALAAELRVHSCNNAAYVLTNNVTAGGRNPTKRCREAQASDAFMWFGFAAYLASMIFSIFASRGSGLNMRGVGGIRRGGPAMSQRSAA